MSLAVAFRNAVVLFLLVGEFAHNRRAGFVAERTKVGGNRVGDVAEDALRFHRVVISVFGKVHFVAVVEDLALNRACGRFLVVDVDLDAFFAFLVNVVLMKVLVLLLCSREPVGSVTAVEVENV